MNDATYCSGWQRLNCSKDSICVSVQLFSKRNYWNSRSKEYVCCGSKDPESCIETTGPVLFVTEQPSLQVILDSLEWHKSLLHDKKRLVKSCTGLLDNRLWSLKRWMRSAKQSLHKKHTEVDRALYSQGLMSGIITKTYGYPLFMVTDLNVHDGQCKEKKNRAMDVGYWQIWTFTTANAKKKRTELWKSSICDGGANLPWDIYFDSISKFDNLKQKDAKLVIWALRKIIKENHKASNSCSSFSRKQWREIRGS